LGSVSNICSLIRQISQKLIGNIVKPCVKVSDLYQTETIEAYELK